MSAPSEHGPADVELRNDHVRDGCGVLLCLGVLLFGAIILHIGLSDGDPFTITFGVLFGGLFGGAPAVLFARRGLDRSPRLSITAEGLHDHRTGRSVRWSGARGFRLDVRSDHLQRERTVLYVRVAGDAEVAVDVTGLDLYPSEIVCEVERRMRAAGAPPVRPLGVLTADC